jgi:hypothetical protein
VCNEQRTPQKRQPLKDGLSPCGNPSVRALRRRGSYARAAFIRTDEKFQQQIHLILEKHSHEQTRSSILTCLSPRPAAFANRTRKWYSVGRVRFHSMLFRIAFSMMRICCRLNASSDKLMKSFTCNTRVQLPSIQK